MSKPKKLGPQSTYIPNAKADMRLRKKTYQRGREVAERDPHDICQRRELKRLERVKADAYRTD